ncbi:MAG: 30S ribosomal protein S12 methylthiotransferase RimO [Lachnospiraceae bacterium]|nr:30S ribosomal protein S12 methylthiotransferase RimO [Lachnospiraceae bacterium]
MRPSSDHSETQRNPETLRIFFVSLGCDKNLVDSSQMMGLLSSEGYIMTNDEDEADIIIINSCCFIGDAKQESIDAIIEAGRKKSEGRLKGLIVCGCLAQRYSEEIMKLMPETDVIVGTASIDSIADAVEEAAAGIRAKHTESIDRYSYIKGLAEPAGMPHSSYLKIAEGCNKNCSYCVIPKVRGHYRSVPLEDLAEDAARLAKKGVKELILVAQETTVYGTDLYGEKSLHVLLERLCAIDGIEWIRLMYCYPEEIYDGLIDCIKNEPKICDYLDMPIQHCSDRILRLMGRKTEKRELVDIIQKLRYEIPDIALRTTLISGFPTETEEEHRELLDFVRQMRFDRLGDFPYSREEDTVAAAMEGQIHHAVKKRRHREIMEAQQEIAFERAEGLYGRELSVMIEGSMPEERVIIGRTYMDAPEVDGYVFVKPYDPGLMSGDTVRVMIDGADGYDLTGWMIR